MAFLKSITIRNFKCFRTSTTFKLNQSSYLIGTNNAGKSALINAIHCFFNNSIYDHTFLNRTEFNAKKSGYNRTEISIEFDLSYITGKARAGRMLKKYGSTLCISKFTTYREKSQTYAIDYRINGKSFQFDSLENDVQDLLNAVNISYIHPQEGLELLKQAQSKFKKRLFANWGRHSSVTKELKSLQKKWDDLKKIANTYLSAALTTNIKSIWPSASTAVNLPDKIDDIVSVSDISFKSSSTAPEISLTGQGTGVQSTILYQTHFILDNDRSLHPGMYFPIWLLEEPESFLHADIAFKVGNLLSSQDWLKNIQMVISTHSPIILAATSQNDQNIDWVLIENHKPSSTVRVDSVDDGLIKTIGTLMGDSNFDAYFLTSSNDTKIFLEDSRELTKTAFENIDVPITKSLKGAGSIKRYIQIYEAVPTAINGKIVFIADNDEGMAHLSGYCKAAKIDKRKNNFIRFKIHDKIFVIATPHSTSIEDLFDEFDSYLDDCVEDIWNDDFTLKDTIQRKHSRIVSELRKASNKPSNLDEAKIRIKKAQDIKDGFWKEIETNNYRFNKSCQSAIKTLLEFK